MFRLGEPARPSEREERPCGTFALLAWKKAQAGSGPWPVNLASLHQTSALCGYPSNCASVEGAMCFASECGLPWPPRRRGIGAGHCTKRYG